MSKRVSKAASLELTFLAALENVHADVDISEIAEIQDWSRAVRGKLYGAMVKDASNVSKQKADLPPALKPPIATTPPDSSSKDVNRVVLGASSNVTSHGNVQYSQMEIPQLIAVGISESSEEAWSEFVRRSQPVIKAVIIKLARRLGAVSHQFVDDLIQDVYLKLCADNFRALRNFEILQENYFFVFLKVVARHTVEDYFRKAAASKRRALYETEVPIEAPNASPAPEREILFQEIDTILKTHEHEPNFDRDRTIFWLYYRQGLPATEIAALPDINLPVKSVENILLQLTRQLKVALR